MEDRLRVDKWLWSVRIFKSRTIAAEACKKGRVKVDDIKVKPSFLVKKENTLTVSKNGFNYTLKILQLLERRVSATLAKEAYLDLTPEEELNKYNDWFIGKGKPEIRTKGSGRPTKKERRNLDRYKDQY
jgi:ribosome-associated heat shock protein Hsp15